MDSQSFGSVRQIRSNEFSKDVLHQYCTRAQQQCDCIRPRPVIVQLHACLQRPAAQRKRAECTEICKHLHRETFRFALIFPAILKMHQVSQTHTFYMPRETQKFLNTSLEPNRDQDMGMNQIQVKLIPGWIIVLLLLCITWDHASEAGLGLISTKAPRGSQDVAGGSTWTITTWC